MFLASWFYIYHSTLSGFSFMVSLGERSKPVCADQIITYIQFASIMINNINGNNMILLFNTFFHKDIGY